MRRILGVVFLVACSSGPSKPTVVAQPIDKPPTPTAIDTGPLWKPRDDAKPAVIVATRVYSDAEQAELPKWEPWAKAALGPALAALAKCDPSPGKLEQDLDLEFEVIDERTVEPTSIIGRWPTTLFEKYGAAPKQCIETAILAIKFDAALAPTTPMVYRPTVKQLVLQFELELP